MTDRETVAAAILAKMRGGACEWNKLPRTDQEFGLGLADAAYAAITYVAAERGWHMRPDEPTAEMQEAAMSPNGVSRYPARTYRAMLAATREFQWGQ